MRPSKRAVFARHLLIAGLCCLLVAPFLWMISTSLKSPVEVALRDPTIIPSTFEFENYSRVFSRGNFGRYFWNSILVSAATTFLSVAVATLAGYAFARLSFRGRGVLFMLVLSMLFVPIQPGTTARTGNPLSGGSGSPFIA